MASKLAHTLKQPMTERLVTADTILQRKTPIPHAKNRGGGAGLGRATHVAPALPGTRQQQKPYADTLAIYLIEPPELAAST
ncbi:MAG: hypothetical protein R2856_29540 [Caldilineaceae bacterium]